MPNQLAVGAAGGSLSTFVLSLLHHLVIQSDPGIAIPDITCNCPELQLDWDNYSQLIIFGSGIALGLGLGLFLDLLWVVKERWRRFLLGRLVGSQPPTRNLPLHKVLHE